MRSSRGRCPFNRREVIAEVNPAFPVLGVRPARVDLSDVLEKALIALHPLPGGVVVKDDIRRDQFQQAVVIVADPSISIRLDES